MPSVVVIKMPERSMPTPLTELIQQHLADYHFGASGSPGRYCDLVEIQSRASFSVAKSPL
jgi:hypothetical protein